MRKLCDHDLGRLLSFICPNGTNPFPPEKGWALRDMDSPFGPRPPRRWSAVSWRYSLLLIVPLVGVLLTVIYLTILDPGGTDGVVVDAYSGSPIDGATIDAGDQRVVSDGGGRFDLNDGVTTLQVSKDGYDPATVTLASTSDPIEIRLRPNVVTGTVTNRITGEPITGVTVAATRDGTAVVDTTTDVAGAFTLADVPAGASLSIDPPDYSAASIDLNGIATVDVTLRPDVLSGTVTDAAGQPIAGATIAVPGARATSAEDGTFRLEGAPDSGNVVVKAPGYRVATATIDPALRVTATLEPVTVKALYATADSVAQQDKLAELVGIIDTTEANALVVDLKDSSGFVFYDTKVQLAHDIDAVRAAYDPAAVVQMLHDHGIYVIARIVVFEDPILAEARPEWAIHDSADGDLWRTWNGIAWVNAHRSEVWDYNIALASEAAALGFDEIQLDYIRFPSDGPLDRAEYGVPHDDETRPAAIGQFLTRMYDAIAPTRAYLAADVFGVTLWELGDGGIGQHLETVVPVLDYICPMIYPSHFYSGSMGFDIPNDHPYEVILWSLQNGNERIPQYHDKLRPWLQDFSYGAGIEYGEAEVRAQIQAAEEFGATGWMLWNSGSGTNNEAALNPE